MEGAVFIPRMEMRARVMLERDMQWEGARGGGYGKGRAGATIREVGSEYVLEGEKGGNTGRSEGGMGVGIRGRNEA